jgi:hypothetical protein
MEPVIHPRPEGMTEVHVLILTQLWFEGLTPTSLIMELSTLCDLKPHEARNIVMHWLWKENFKL